MFLFILSARAINIVKMSDLKLIDLKEQHFTESVVSWHRNHHAQYYSASGRVFTRQYLIEEYKRGRESKTSFQFLIVHKKDNQEIGIVKIQSIDAHKKGDIVYFIGDENYLGRGLGTQAIKLALKIAFQKLDLRKIHGPCFKSNRASISAALKAGYVIEGILKSHYFLNGVEDDAVLIACFNPRYFSQNDRSFSNYKLEDVYGNE